MKKSHKKAAESGVGVWGTGPPQSFFDILRIYVVSVATQASGTCVSTPPCLRASFLVSASNYRKKRSTQRKRAKRKEH